jgi:hypothetical protein
VRTGAILGSPLVKGNSIDPTFQLYPHAGKTIIRNCVYRRRVPAAALVFALARGTGREDRFHRLLLAAARRQRCVHVWGHAADLERLGLWATLRRLLLTAAELGLVPVSNSEAFDRLSRQETT